MIFTHLGNKYYYENGVYYQNENALKHFLQIAKNYPYFDLILQKFNIFIEKQNNYHTSFADCEAMCIHFLERHIERYTIIHEFTHCLQFLSGFCDAEAFENTEFDMAEPCFVDFDENLLTLQNHKKSTIKEPAGFVLDIFNSFALGGYAQIIGTRSHIPRYYKDDLANYLLESHASYCCLLFNKNYESLEKIPKVFLDKIKKYDKQVMNNLIELGLIP